MIRKTYRYKDGKVVKGVLYSAFINNGGFYLTDIGVFEDGMIDCWEWVDFEGFKGKVNEGWVRTEIPENAEFSIFRIGSVASKGGNLGIPESEFLKEVEDTIAALQNRPTRSDRCRSAFEQFLKDRTEKNRADLKAAYEDVPIQLRRILLGDMDRKDYPIKIAIKNPDEFSEEQLDEMLRQYFPDEEELERQRKFIEEFKKENNIR